MFKKVWLCRFSINSKIIFSTSKLKKYSKWNMQIEQFKD